MRLFIAVALSTAVAVSLPAQPPAPEQKGVQKDRGLKITDPLTGQSRPVPVLTKGTVGTGRTVGGYLIDPINPDCPFPGQTLTAPGDPNWQVNYPTAPVKAGLIDRVETTDPGDVESDQVTVNVLPARTQLTKELLQFPKLPRPRTPRTRKPVLRIDVPADGATIKAGTVKVQGIIRPTTQIVHAILIEPKVQKAIVVLGTIVQHGPSWRVELRKVEPGNYLIRARSLDGVLWDQVKVSVVK